MQVIQFTGPKAEMNLLLTSPMIIPAQEAPVNFLIANCVNAENKDVFTNTSKNR